MWRYTFSADVAARGKKGFELGQCGVACSALVWQRVAKGILEMHG
jgi:hypothetical protein